MSSLTQLIVSPQGSRTPLMIEVPVPPSLEGPFLVTSSKGFIWIYQKFPNDTVRSAVRKVPVAFLFRDALYKVASMARESEWGNFLPCTEEGVLKALAHLREYGMEEVEVLHGPEFDETLLPDQIPCHEALWVPADWAVVLPTDRSYVGTCFDFGEGQVALVLHNASRGIGIIAPGLS